MSATMSTINRVEVWSPKRGRTFATTKREHGLAPTCGAKRSFVYSCIIIINIITVLVSSYYWEGVKATAYNDTDSCKSLNANLVNCDFNKTCVYGEPNTVKCHNPQADSKCQSFLVTFACLYCWQLPEEAYSCTDFNVTCKANSRFKTTCTVNPTTYCLGHRKFERYKQCNSTTGHKWSIAVVLSILFGGFGLDRFYLGHWQEGVGKLFSFGGFGVWTLIDAVLISIGYLKPDDPQSD